MSIQSSLLDPVLGLDVHIVIIPAVPTPILAPVPIPFVGMVFDPLGLAIGAAISMVTAGNPGLVLVNNLPATNCGTDVTNALTMPHVAPPPSVFATSGTPAKIGDAQLFFGSNNVSLMGSFGVRLFDTALTCSDPIRLPTGMVMAFPKGRPVVNMAPMVPDVQAMVMAAVFHYGLRALGALARRGARLFRALRPGSRFMGRVSQALGGCVPPATAARWRQMWSRAVRFVTGHPVDVVTGNLFTSVVDLALPGPWPLVIERVYESAGSGKPSTLGHGWNHTLDESLWFERGRAVVRCGDGREIEFPLWELPGRVMRSGDVVERLIHKLKLRCINGRHFELEHADGRVHRYAPVTGDVSRARLIQIRSRGGHHTIDLTYDDAGRLEWVRDCAGRRVAFEHDGTGRLRAIKVPLPHGHGYYLHRRYSYDARGDLVAVTDAAGGVWKYAYKRHLLVHETDRAGLSFYFQYDGLGSNAKCVRTWGDGGIYDHVITYDVRNRRSIVEDSLGATVVYAYNERNQIVSIMNPHGGTTRYSHDPQHGQVTEVVDPVGLSTRTEYDERGNVVRRQGPSGAFVEIANGPFGATSIRNERGAIQHALYDRHTGELVATIDSMGIAHRFDYENGLLKRVRRSTAVVDAATVLENPLWATEVEVEHDERKNVSCVRLADGTETRFSHDLLSRETKIVYANGAAVTTSYDALGAVREVGEPLGRRVIYERNAESYLVGATRIDSRGRQERVSFAYQGKYWVSRREQAGIPLVFEYDTEGQLIAIVREGGERAEFKLNHMGSLQEETRFDGGRVHYQHDTANRLTKIMRSGADGVTTGLEYDALGHIARVAMKALRREAEIDFAWDGSGLMAAVLLRSTLTLGEASDRRTETASVRTDWERDALGRVVAEHQTTPEGTRTIRSSYDAWTGRRIRLESSLGHVQAYELDEVGQCSAVVVGDGGAWRAQLLRDRFGRELGRILPGGVEQRFQRDALGRPQWMQARNGRGDVLAERRYEWNTEEQLAAIVDVRGGGDRTSYAHDALGQLAQASYPGGREELRMHDAAGNLYRRRDGSDRRYGQGGTLLEAEGTTYEHDSDGRRTRRLRPDGSETLYAWDALGQLAEVATDVPKRDAEGSGIRVRFEHDLFSRRVAKRVYRVEHWRDDLDGSGRPELVKSEELLSHERYVWDGGRMLHVIREGEAPEAWVFDPESHKLIGKEQGKQRWGVLTDHIGTPTELTDSLGQVAWRMQLDAFGVPQAQSGHDTMMTSCPWRFPGQYADDECGLHYNRHRYYDPETGTYLSRDPDLLGTGIPYQYCPDPAVQTDPFGRALRRHWGLPEGRGCYQAFITWFDSAPIDDIRSLQADVGEGGGNERFGDLYRGLTAERLGTGAHEWMSVEKAARFREWGISMATMSRPDMTSATSTLSFYDTVARTTGLHHVSRESSRAHTELARLVDESSGYDDWVRRLNLWAAGDLPGYRYRLPNGIDDLPPGLRRPCA